MENIANAFGAFFQEHLGNSAYAGYFAAFITSLFPVLECRGGVIVAKLFDVNMILAFIVCYIGNMIPVPFILLFIKKIFEFMKKHNILTKFINKLESKTENNKDKIMRRKEWGLLAFVAVPLPGTGGWTGSLFASLLNVDFKKALGIIALGVLCADLIMTFGVSAVSWVVNLVSGPGAEAAMICRMFITG